MALERLFGWLTTPVSEVESREKELQPLTEEEVTTYGSYGNSSDRVSDEYVIISESSEGEGSLDDNTDGDRLEGLQALPPSQYKGILKTVHVTKSSSPHPPYKTHSIEWRSRADMPVRMKGLQATLHRGHVFVGGGYTGHSHTEMTVYEYDPTFNQWVELPVAPMRWFGIAEFKGQLVLVGGKDIERRGMKLTNRIAVYDDDKSIWLHPYPPMSAARSQPVVFSHAHLLVVAGGRKGVLDFNVEVFNGVQWLQASPLPAPCSPFSSLIHNNHWYLVGGVRSTTIYHVALEDYLAPQLGAGQGAEKGVGQEAGHEGRGDTLHHHSRRSVWETLTPPPFSVTCIMSLGHYVTVFPSAAPHEGAGSSVQVHQLLGEGWTHVGHVPHVCGSASSLWLPRGELLLFGGDVDGRQYSNRVYRVTVGSAGAQRKKTKFAT